jgi:hypothetical protein
MSDAICQNCARESVVRVVELQRRSGARWALTTKNLNEIIPATLVGRRFVVGELQDLPKHDAKRVVS